MSKTLLSGLAALLVGTILSTVLPSAWNIAFDFTSILDGDITVADLLFVAGSVLTTLSDPVRNQLQRTTPGRMIFGAPSIHTRS